MNTSIPEWCLDAATDFLTHLEAHMQSRIPREILGTIANSLGPQRMILAGMIAKRVPVATAPPVAEMAVAPLAVPAPAFENPPGHDTHCLMLYITEALAAGKPIRAKQLATDLGCTMSELDAAIEHSAGSIVISGPGWVKFSAAP